MSDLILPSYRARRGSGPGLIDRLPRPLDVDPRTRFQEALTAHEAAAEAGDEVARDMADASQDAVNLAQLAVQRGARELQAVGKPEQVEDAGRSTRLVSGQLERPARLLPCSGCPAARNPLGDNPIARIRPGLRLGALSDSHRRSLPVRAAGQANAIPRESRFRANRELTPDDEESRGAAEAGGWLMIRLRHTLRIG